jgi:membrane protein YqaA with SNARE-associated domain
MGRVVALVSEVALTLGGTGLFVVALLDSSFLSLPEVPDLLVIWLVTQRKHRLVMYVAGAVAGSMIGSFVMYYVGLKGGQALIQKRFGGRIVDRSMHTLRRHGALAVWVTSMLPPPTPLKLFVLLAGMAGISQQKFLLAIGAGRTIRYLALGVLAVKYGDRAIDYVHQHGTKVGLVVIAVFTVVAVAYFLWPRRASSASS